MVCVAEKYEKISRNAKKGGLFSSRLTFYSSRQVLA